MVTGSNFKVYIGFGVFTHANGDIYEGDWVKGKANGFGKFTTVSGLIYYGNYSFLYL